MKRSSTAILQTTVMLIAFVVLCLCVFVLPAGINSDETGAYRPILLGMYVPAVPFFLALQQTLQLLGYINKNQAFSEQSIRALKYVKYCAAAISALYVLGMPYIFYVAEKDDAPGVAAIGFVIIFASFVIATASAVFQGLVRNAVDIKSENDLTV